MATSHDREPHPHLHPPRRRRRDAPRRHEPRAQDAPADRGLRDGRRAQRAARRRARAAPISPPAHAELAAARPERPVRRGRRHLRAPRAATASGCGSTPEQTAWLEQACDEVNAGLPAAAGRSCSPAARRPRRSCTCAGRSAAAPSGGRWTAASEVGPECVRYLNRLSDLLFILSRDANAGRRAPVGAGPVPLTPPVQHAARVPGALPFDAGLRAAARAAARRRRRGGGARGVGGRVHRGACRRVCVEHVVLARRRCGRGCAAAERGPRGARRGRGPGSRRRRAG